MCGIAGIIATSPATAMQQRLQAMTNSMAHRGPDGAALWANPGAKTLLGHRRLSIIDLSQAAAQPMHYKDRYTIVHNGELYNYQELRKQLQQKGFAFTTQSDTEVILAAYACYGQHCLQYFDGMFAFAIWDEQEQALFAARDRFGEKPFFYHWDAAAGQFVFASELKALWAAGIDKQWNGNLLLNFLTHGITQNPADKAVTFYQHITALPPACCLLLQPDTGKLTVNTYWTLSADTTFTGTMQEAAGQLKELLTTAVQRRLRSDVPVGTSLSGGLDSAAIAAIICSQRPDTFKTFSAIFPGFERDESAHIALLAQKLSVDSHTTQPDAAQLIHDFEKLCYHQEQPFGSASIFAQYKVFELAAQQGVTVLLDGQGADETLAGYSKHLHWYLQELWRYHRSAFTEEKAALQASGQPFQWGMANRLAALWPRRTAAALQQRALQQQAQHPFLDKAFLAEYRNTAGLHKPVVKKLNDILYFDTLQLGLEELLRCADRNSMAHSRELRLPFLSHELVAFVFSLPATFKINKGYTKAVLRNAVSAYLPKEIVWNPVKTGFEPPQQQWMQQPVLQEYIQAARKKLVQQGILQPGVLSKKIQPAAAHDAQSFDWRCLTAASTLL